MDLFSHYNGETLACRICLSVDVKLYSFHDYRLLEMYRNITGMSISAFDGFPHYICSFCRHMLHKSADFKSMCQMSYMLLQKESLTTYPLSTSHIQNLPKGHLKIPLTINKLENIDYIDTPDIFVDEIKIENLQFENENDPIESRDINDFGYDINDSGHEINDSGYDINDSGHEINDSGQIHSPGHDLNDESSTDDIPLSRLKVNELELEKEVKRKKKSKKKKAFESSKNKINEFIVKYINVDDSNDNKKAFYKYILDKYIKKYIHESNETNEDNKNDDLCMKTKNSIFISIDNGNITDNTNIDDKIKNINPDNINKRKFYEFIKRKYDKNNKILSKNVIDITRMRSKKVKKNKMHKTKSQDEDNFSKAYHVDIHHLTREEQIADVIGRKETDKYNKAMFKCEDCLRGFTVEKAFQNHMAIHDPSAGPYVCEICRVRFLQRGRLTKHMQLRHKLKFICQICHQVTRNSTSARHHYKCHVGYKYDCEFCGKVFSKYGSRMNHIRLAHGSVRCRLCQMTFSCRAGLAAHHTKAHRELFKCGTCTVQFHNPDALKRHVDTAPGGCCGPDIRPCTQCGDNFDSEELMRSHMQLHSKPMRIRSPPEKTAEDKPKVRWLARKQPRPQYFNFPNTIIKNDNSTYINQLSDFNKPEINATNHNKSETIETDNNNSNNLTVINNDLTVSNNNNTHNAIIVNTSNSDMTGVSNVSNNNMTFDNINNSLSVANNNNTHNAIIVNNSNTNSNMIGVSNDNINNNLTVTNSNNMTLNNINKDLTGVNNVNNTNNDSGSKTISFVKRRKPVNYEPPQKLMCEMCAADGFASVAVLRYHQRIHTGERPHPCPHCHKRFRIRELLQKHLRTHSGARPYQCSQCPKAFKTASALHTHQLVHTKIRRYSCHLCNKAFLTSTCVKTHVNTVHMRIPTNRRDNEIPFEKN